MNREAAYTLAWHRYDPVKKTTKAVKPSISLYPHQARKLVEAFKELKAEADRLGLKEPM